MPPAVKAWRLGRTRSAHNDRTGVWGLRPQETYPKPSPHPLHQPGEIPATARHHALNDDLLHRHRAPLPIGPDALLNADFTAAARAGMTIIHVSSELRLAWRRGVEEGLKDPNEIAPYKLVAPSVVNIQKIVTDRLKLFNGLA